MVRLITHLTPFVVAYRGKEVIHMMDLIMIAILLGSIALIAGLIHWCDRQVETD